MTQSGPPSIQNRERARPTDGRKPEPQQRLSDYFRFRPIPFAKDVLAEANHQKTRKEKRDYITDAIRVICRIPAGSRIVQLLLFIIAVAYTAYMLRKTGNLEPDWIMAIFTIALCAIAAVQWWTTHGQLKQMRLEQRAWLGSGTPELEPLVVGERVKCKVYFHNSGRTPARIHLSTAAPLILPSGIENIAFGMNDEIIRRFEMKPSVGVLSPGGVLSVSHDDTQIVTQEMIDGIADGTQRLWVFTRVYYQDIVENKMRWTTLYFTWNREAGHLHAHDKGNEMT